MKITKKYFNSWRAFINETHSHRRWREKDIESPEDKGDQSCEKCVSDDICKTDEKKFDAWFRNEDNQLLFRLKAGGVGSKYIKKYVAKVVRGPESGPAGPVASLTHLYNLVIDEYYKDYFSFDRYSFTGVNQAKCCCWHPKTQNLLKKAMQPQRFIDTVKVIHAKDPFAITDDLAMTLGLRGPPR